MRIPKRKAPTKLTIKVPNGINDFELLFKCLLIEYRPIAPKKPPIPTISTYRNVTTFEPPHLP
jgi:hypothetical protein